MPRAQFTGIDSIEKKIRYARQLAEEFGVENIRFVRGRTEALKERFDTVLARGFGELEATLRSARRLGKRIVIYSTRDAYKISGVKGLVEHSYRRDGSDREYLILESFT